MIECELCHGRMLCDWAIDDDDRLLFLTERCQECGHIPRHYNDLAAIERFTSWSLDDYAETKRKSGRPHPSAGAGRQSSQIGLWPFEEPSE